MFPRKNKTRVALLKSGWGKKEAFGLLMFVYILLQAGVCQGEMNAEWGNKGGDGWFPEFYAKQPSFTHSAHCQCLLNVNPPTPPSLWHTCRHIQADAEICIVATWSTSSISHTHAHTYTHTHTHWHKLFRSHFRMLNSRVKPSASIWPV